MREAEPSAETVNLFECAGAELTLGGGLNPPRTIAIIEVLDLEKVIAAARLQGAASKEVEIGMHMICVGQGTDYSLSVRGHQPAIEAVQAIIGDHQATMAELNRLKAQMAAPPVLMIKADAFDPEELKEMLERGWNAGAMFVPTEPTPLSAAHPLNDSVAALMAAQREPLKKQKGERDTEFVKRIVQAYHRAAEENAPPMTAAAFEAFDNHSRPHFSARPRIDWGSWTPEQRSALAAGLTQPQRVAALHAMVQSMAFDETGGDRAEKSAAMEFVTSGGRSKLEWGWGVFARDVKEALGGDQAFWDLAAKIDEARP